MEPYIANTDHRWFNYLTSISAAGRLDEVNFWSPQAQRPMKAMSPGAPVFFRLKSPISSIAGYGFFAHFAMMPMEEAWTCFGNKNGESERDLFFQQIGGYQEETMPLHQLAARSLACTILRPACFWPRDRWIRWAEGEGWSSNTVQGKTERDPVRASRILSEITYDHDVASEYSEEFSLIACDERKRAAAVAAMREGQGTFRARLLGAYRGACAITGEHTEPVLDAAHIQPYLGPRSNHVQNGIVLTKEFHTLFDMGLVAITSDYRVRVSSRIRERWHNGHRYYAFDNQPLKSLPANRAQRPSREALQWHTEKIFVA
ncbi:MAG: HNH endonuclease [Planctomycetes bacterium]|nr:HNH endonuclease [Planctomycetota bacterium]